jgi:hypothetical protein
MLCVRGVIVPPELHQRLAAVSGVAGDDHRGEQVARCIHRHRDLFEPRGRDNQPVGKRGGGRKRQTKPNSGPVTSTNDGRRVHMQNLHKARMEAARREADEFEAGTSPLLQIHASDEERLAMAKELHELGDMNATGH